MTEKSKPDFDTSLKDSQFHLHKADVTSKILYICVYMIVRLTTSCVHYTGLNNGSFGSCPDEVTKAQHDLQQRWYENPGECC